MADSQPRTQGTPHSGRPRSANPDDTTSPCLISVATVLSCIRSCYPHNVVPGEDYPALLALLRRHLPVDAVLSVATELIVRGTSPLRGIDLRRALSALPHAVPDADIARLADRLRIDS